MVWLYGVKEGLCRGNGKDNGNYRLGFMGWMLKILHDLKIPDTKESWYYIILSSCRSMSIMFCYCDLSCCYCKFYCYCA